MDLEKQPVDDHEAKMARAELYKLNQYSAKLFKLIGENDELDGWVQSKITKAADYISSVYLKKWQLVKSNRDLEILKNLYKTKLNKASKISG